MTRPSTNQKRRRKRGVILTKAGFTRFQAAKADAEYKHNGGNRYTLEALSEKTGVSMDTLTKVFACETRVDKQTLKCCFSAFDLALTSGDYYSPEDLLPTQKNQKVASQVSAAIPTQPSPPGGQIPVDSPVYIPRSTVEEKSFRAIDQPGALIRLKGAHQTGKTSLMVKISHEAKQRDYQPVYISFQLAEKSVLGDLDKLLKWVCANVGLGLSVSPDLDTYWDAIFGSKMSCKLYFEEYLLPAAQKPVLLLLDDVERLFNDTEIADEFFGFLRTCYEEAKTSEIWQQLRMVIAQTSEVYIPLNINKSPFNVGTAIPLSPFEPGNIQALATVYGLHWSSTEATALYDLLNGQPYLIHLAAYHVSQGQIAVEDILNQGAECPIFLPYLQRQQRQLKQNTALESMLNQLLTQDSDSAPVSAGSVSAGSGSDNAIANVYRLQGLGLVTLTEKGPQISCNLLRDYFSTALDCA